MYYGGKTWLSSFLELVDKGVARKFLSGKTKMKSVTVKPDFLKYAEAGWQGRGQKILREAKQTRKVETVYYLIFLNFCFNAKTIQIAFSYPALIIWFSHNFLRPVAIPWLRPRMNWFKTWLYWTCCYLIEQLWTYRAVYGHITVTNTDLYNCWSNNAYVRRNSKNIR